MKKILFALLMAMVTVGAWAQPGQRRNFSPEESANRQATQLKQDCDSITEEQYKAVYDVFLQSAKQMQAERDSIMKAGGQGDMRGRFNREAMQARQDAINMKLMGILSTKQYTAYTEAQKKRAEQRRNGRGNGRGGNGGGPRF